MRLLADENIPGVAVRRLRGAQHDVLWIRESFPAKPDTDIMRLAVREKRIIITFDKDFGEMAVTGQGKIPPGIVLLRISKRSPQQIAEAMERVLGDRDDWSGHLAVIDDTHIRMRPL
jgi:predicted nuclease of predicted toxin-antitoxin system